MASRSFNKQVCLCQSDLSSSFWYSLFRAYELSRELSIWGDTAARAEDEPPSKEGRMKSRHVTLRQYCDVYRYNARQGIMLYTMNFHCKGDLSPSETVHFCLGGNNFSKYINRKASIRTFGSRHRHIAPSRDLWLDFCRL